ncbi:MAG: hypothetical protein LBD41_03620, partial [Clostridiales Family XIII bacterium]|nr:hypothetical protein [Clostridiales Family XIII bacterium]
MKKQILIKKAIANLIQLYEDYQNEVTPFEKEEISRILSTLETIYANQDEFYKGYQDDFEKKETSRVLSSTFETIYTNQD